MEVVVEYDYDALHDDELTLRPGDVIKNVRHIEEDGWMEGDLHGRRGLFPDNFVKEVKKDSKEEKETKHETREESSVRREKSSGTVANLVQRMSTIGLPTGAFPPPPPAASKKPKRRQCKVLFDYQPANEDELELKVGDTIDIIEEVEEGWWSGSMNGRSGLFPSNFVKELGAEDSDSNEAAADETNKDEKDGVAPETIFSPTSPTAGNGSIAQPKKVRGIGFGDIFKEGSVRLKARLPSPDTEDRKDKPIPSLPSAAKPSPANMSDLLRLDGDVKVKAKECCKVTFPFEATNEDELTLRVDDIIFIISKDTGEPGWWRGENAGREGVFPDNFVSIISDTEREAHVSRGSVKASPKQEQEEKPRKPPPPSKTTALKPEVPSADRKPHYRTEDREKPTADHRSSKPAAPPVVPPKKPVPPPGKGRPGGVPPKRPDKPLPHSPNLKHNGEAPPTRPKSDLEPSVPTKPKTLSGDWGEKTPDADLISFDELSTTSEKLSHPTANRPKMPGRRLPAHFSGGPSPNIDINADKGVKADDDDEDDEDAPKLKPSDTRKPTTHTFSSSPPFHKPPAEARPGPAVSHSLDLSGPTQTSRVRLEPQESSTQLEELRGQMKELLMFVDLMKTQQQKEIADLRGALDAEIQKRVSLQVILILLISENLL
uniref:Osteoclast-stimulating factor 1 n=1 Tax=Gouania willdenowi TaxID=441366 RepID=A0A8C5DIT3_GOUWI